MTQPEIAEKTGIGKAVVQDVVESARIRRYPRPLRDDLSLSAQEKFDLAVKREKHRLGVTFEQVVQERVNEKIKLYREEFSSKIKAEQEEAQRIIKGRRGIMTQKAYRKIKACLHPDRALHPARDTDEGLRKAYEEAFEIWARMERLVLDEKACPTSADRKSPPIPKTPQEWEEWERKATAERKAQYAARKANKNKSVSPV